MTSPDTTLGSFVASHQLQARISDAELAVALDYKHVLVVTLIKSGAMRLPFMKVIVLAEALRADARVVLRLTMDEAIPGLYELVEKLMSPTLVSANSVALINPCKQLGQSLPPA